MKLECLFIIPSLKPSLSLVVFLQMLNSERIGPLIVRKDVNMIIMSYSDIVVTRVKLDTDSSRIGRNWDIGLNGSLIMEI